MTPTDLQSVFADEITQLFSAQRFWKQGQDGEEDQMAPLSVYKQALPYFDGYSFSDYAPYVTVQVHSGSQDEETEPGEAVIMLNFGFYDPGKENQGHILLLNTIETIRQDLFAKRTLVGKYFVKTPWKWQINDEDVWPYFIGSVETHWNMPITQVEDENI